MSIVLTDEEELQPEPQPQPKYVQVWLPYINNTIKMSLRARMILPRLAVVAQKRPATITGLRELVGAFISRDAISRALKQLEPLKLAKKTATGWEAVEPTGSVREAFRWKKKASGPWFNRYVHLTIPLPVSNPFPCRPNALELFAVWHGMNRLNLLEQPITNRRLSRFLGISRDCVIDCRKTLREVLPSLPKPEYMTYQSASTEQPGSVAAKLRELGVGQPEAVIAVAKLKSVYGRDLLKLVGKLAEKHDRERFGPDLTGFALTVLTTRKRKGAARITTP